MTCVNMLLQYFSSLSISLLSCSPNIDPQQRPLPFTHLLPSTSRTVHIKPTKPCSRLQIDCISKPPKRGKTGWRYQTTHLTRFLKLREEQKLSKSAPKATSERPDKAESPRSFSEHWGDLKGLCFWISRKIGKKLCCFFNVVVDK